jgi:hypothetical protein
MIETLNTFVDEERERFTTFDNNKFAFSFSQIARYLGFVHVIVVRHADAGLKFVANTKALQAAAPSGGLSLTEEQRRLLDEGHKLTDLLHLEVESFFLFAKILLDKIAHSIEFYFGQGRGKPLDSHDDLVKNFGEYSHLKKLSVPANLPTLASSLKKDISDLRDYRIAHDKNPRRVLGTAFNTDGTTSMISTTIYPTPKDKQLQTRDLNDLVREIEEYIGTVIDFIRANRGLTNLKVQTNP